MPSSSTSGWPPSSAATGPRPSCSTPRRRPATRSLGLDDAGAIAVGQRADLVTLDTATPRTAGTGRDEHTAVFAATAADVTQVVVDGRVVVGAGRRRRRSAASWPRRSRGCGTMSEHRDHPHRRADHQRPRARGTARARQDAARGDRGRHGSPGSGPAGRRPEPPTRTSTPGAEPCSRASSTATPTWCSPATGPSEFAARMTGEPYAAGGIRTTVAATRAATDEQLTAHVARLVQEMLRQGTTTVEIKSGYGLTVHDEARSLAVARQFTDETTFLGAHVVPAEHAEDPAAYVDLVTGPMLDAAAPYASWIDAFCETGAFDADQARAVLDGRRRRRGCAAGCTPTSSVRVRASRLACELGPGRGRPLHLPVRRGRRRAARLRDDRDPAAGRRVLDPAALPRRPPADRRRGAGRDRQRLQPGLVLHLLDAAVRRARRAGDADEPGRGGATPPPTGAPTLWAATTSGVLAPGARADLVLLDAPLARAPGLPARGAPRGRGLAARPTRLR